MMGLKISAYQNGAQWAECRLKPDQHAKRDEMDTSEKQNLLSGSTEAMSLAVYHALTGNTDDDFGNYFSSSLTYQSPEREYFLRGVIGLEWK